jgi:hypothetical protein
LEKFEVSFHGGKKWYHLDFLILGTLKSCLNEKMTTYKIISKGIPCRAQDT